MAFNLSDLLDIVTPMIGRDEGCSLTVYWDSIGQCWTIGWGRADPGVTQGMTCTQEQADLWRDKKIASIIAQLDAAIPWWRNMDPVRAAVLVDMAYEIGVHGLMGFPLMLHAAQVGNWGEAAAELQSSLLAKQVPNRVARLERQYITGVVQ